MGKCAKALIKRLNISIYTSLKNTKKGKRINKEGENNMF